MSGKVKFRSKGHPKKVFISGARGYLGSHLYEQLEKESIEVSGDRPEGLRRGERFFRPALEDENYWISVLQQHHAIVHLAGNTDLEKAEQGEKTGNITDVNIIKSIVSAAKISGTCPLLIFASTATVYGPSPSLPVNEEHPLNPVTAYDRSKLLVESEIRSATVDGCLRGIILRLPNIYGMENAVLPAGKRGVLNKAILQAISGVDLKVSVSGKNLRDYLHLLDFARAVILCLRSDGIPNAIYNLGSGTAIDLVEAFGIVCRESNLVTGRKCKVIVEEVGELSSEILSRSYLADSSKFSHVTSWGGRLSLQDGVRRSIFIALLAKSSGFRPLNNGNEDS